MHLVLLLFVITSANLTFGALIFANSSSALLFSTSSAQALAAIAGLVKSGSSVLTE